MTTNKRTEIIQIDGRNAELTRKNIKNMYLRYKDGKICISAPEGMRIQEIKAFVHERSDWINAAEKHWKEQEESRERTAGRTKEEQWNDWTRLKGQLTERIAFWAPKMGVRPNGFKIRKMKTRWGSCNVQTHHMTFNMELAYVPEDCLEYVVVHELSHLIEPSHNERFWRTMETYLPDAKERRKKLKGYSV